MCGSGVGGGGGLAEGRVKEAILPGLGHLMPFGEYLHALKRCTPVFVVAGELRPMSQCSTQLYLPKEKPA